MLHRRRSLMKIFWFELGIVRMVQTVQPREKSLLLLYNQKVSCYNIHKYRTYILTVQVGTLSTLGNYMTSVDGKVAFA